MREFLRGIKQRLGIESSNVPGKNAVSRAAEKIMKRRARSIGMGYETYREFNRNNPIGSITLSNPSDGRGFEGCATVLGMSPDDLEKHLAGHRTLDLGGAQGGRLQSELIDRLRRRGANPALMDATQVVSLSPAYKKEKYTKLPSGKKGEHMVAGYGEDLPFKDGAFDRIVAIWSTSQYAPENVPLWIAEIYRVLESGGIALIMPFKNPRFDFDQSSPYPRMRENLLKIFTEMGGTDSTTQNPNAYFSFDFTLSNTIEDQVLILKKLR
jgi:SAM-dependent methyltransferase